MATKTEQNSGSTLTFSLVCSRFKDDGEGSSTESCTITRIFERSSPSLSQHGHWRCVFTETKKRTVELQLSMSWLPHQDTPPTVTQQEPSKTHLGASSQVFAHELISRVQSIKIRSDSTLSELLVGRLDGRRILAGDSIQESPRPTNFPVTIQPDRVKRNGRYKFSIAFYTQDVSRSRFLDHPIFTSFLDIDAGFEPTRYKSDVPPDVCFQFPQFPSAEHPTTILAHSSALEESQYFALRLAKVAHEKELEGTSFSGIMCSITEFTPSVFRVLLRYLYTGQVRLKKTPEEATYRGSSPMDTSGTTQMEATYHKSQRTSEIGWRRTRARSPASVFFEDLYRVAERYEVAGLKELSLKAMQCTLNMSIAISMLSKTRYETELQGLQGDDDSKKERFFNKVQMDMAASIIKEYIQFFGTKLSPAGVNQGQGQERKLSLQERKDMIAYIGDFVLRHISRLWE
ncbi:hypothetical protein BGZ75_009159 [Mortierella antarctica]|nr:hypothetical protein BGZ75_009159 [Mortierella antarctica]